MDQSIVYERLHYLQQLGQANKPARKLLVRFMTRPQMQAVSEVVRLIVQGFIHVLQQDASHFRERSLLLRQLIDGRISLQRKKNALMTFHETIPRLMRSQYLNRAIVFSLRSGEQ